MRRVLAIVAIIAASTTAIAHMAPQEARPVPREARLDPQDAPPARGASTLIGTIMLGGNTRAGADLRIGLGLVGGRPVQEARTREDGTFTFTNVQPRRYSITLIRDGYDVELGRPFLHADKVEHETFLKGVLLRGQVVDERRVPVANVNVCALSQAIEDGHTRYVHAVHTTTNGRGEFEMHDSDRFRGTYLVAAMPAGCTLQADATKIPLRLTRYPPAYYPKGPAPGAATPIAADASNDRTDLTIQMTPGLVTTLVGQLRGYVNDTIVKGRVILEPPPESLVSIVRATNVTRDGRFVFAGLTPGTYRLLAPPLTSAITPFSWAIGTVSIEGQPTRQFAMTLQPAMALGGNVSFHGEVAPLLGVRVFSSISANLVTERLATREQLPSPFASVDGAGKFAIRGLMPGEYRLSVAGYGLLGWAPVSVFPPQMPGQPAPFDALDVPFSILPGRSLFGLRVTMTSQMGSLAGTIMNAAGVPAPRANVVAFSTSTTYWTPRSRRVVRSVADANGAFKVEALPDDEYWVVAVPEGTNVQVTPAGLAALQEQSVKVPVKTGPPTPVVLRLNAGMGRGV